MSHSEAWADIQPIIKTPMNNKEYTKDDIIVKTIMDMLDVAKIQTEIPYNMISFFFSHIDSILEYLIRTDTIQSGKKSMYFREKIMEILEVPNIGTHIELHHFLKKNRAYQDRFNLSLKSITEAMQGGKTFDESIRDHWISKDKRYYNYDLTNLVTYTRLMKNYSMQKYGEMPSEK